MVPAHKHAIKSKNVKRLTFSVVIVLCPVVDRGSHLDKLHLQSNQLKRATYPRQGHNTV